MAAWSDAVALAGLVLAMMLMRRAAAVSGLWLVFTGCAVAMTIWQVASGKIYFGGDGWMVVLYLFAFLGALVVGEGLAPVGDGKGDGGLDNWLIAVVAAALMSVGVALVQWTMALDLGIWVFELAQGQRPYANVAQPNHFSTICFLGLTSLGYLHQVRRIGGLGFWVGSGWLMAGIVMSGSRTGWVQIIALVVGLWLIASRCSFRLTRRSLLALPLGLAAWTTLWPWLGSAMLMSGGRSAASTASAGTRPEHWASMVAALMDRPWTGYGWQQVSVAQFHVAADRPRVGEFIEHTHNLVLDLLIWNGIPIGLLLVGLAAWWFVTRWVACRDGRAAWLLAGACGLLVHALLEYPLDYAYFLIPFGLLIGAVDRLQAGGGSIRLGPRTILFAGAVFTAALLVTAREVAESEQSFRVLRLEAARIGVAQIQTPEPALRLLTQLLAFQRFVRTEARPGMTPAQLEAMRKVAERFSQPSVLFRYALASGLNGDLVAAETTLVRLCRVHPQKSCLEAAGGWIQAQRQYPPLKAIPAPTVPPDADR
jgi:O-antigen ligase